MMDLDEDALLCDFAETYRIYDLDQYPCAYIAALAAGLRDDSRIKVKLSGLRVKPELFALSVCADTLRTLLWFQTKDGQKGRNRPPSILKALSGETTETNKDEIRGFRSGEDFLREWNRLDEEEVQHAGSG